MHGGDGHEEEPHSMYEDRKLRFGGWGTDKNGAQVREKSIDVCGWGGGGGQSL